MGTPLSSEITPAGVWRRRRDFLKNGALLVGTAAVVNGGLLRLTGAGRRGRAEPSGLAGRPITDDGYSFAPASGRSALDEPGTPLRDVASYTNFYELGVDKSDPAANASSLEPRPWTITVTGEVAKPIWIDFVIPWLGFPLADLVRRLAPSPRAKYVAFTTLHDPEQLPGQRGSTLPWPYVEGLRLDEAMHPLVFLAVGLYGRWLPPQNGAPLRLVVPWKYGFKSIKSIVEIRFTTEQPPATWNEVAPREYGFYANVNPVVDHPRWSQATQRRIGDLERRPTLPFNGYAETADSAASERETDIAGEHYSRFGPAGANA